MTDLSRPNPEDSTIRAVCDVDVAVGAGEDSMGLIQVELQWSAVQVAVRQLIPGRRGTCTGDDGRRARSRIVSQNPVVLRIGNEHVVVAVDAKVFGAVQRSDRAVRRFV